MNRFRSRTLGALVAGALLVAACGDDDDDAATDPTTDATPELSGEPIRIGSVASVDGQAITQPEVADALRAAVEGVNARGGVAGRPLELELCDDKATADGALQCGRDLVDDESIVASVGLTSVSGQGYGDLLAQEGVAIVGPYPSAAWELNAATAFPFVGGTVSNYLGVAQVLQEYESPAHIRIDIAQSEQTVQILEGAGVELVEKLAIAPTATDVSPTVTRALEAGADGISIALAEPLTSQVIQAVYQQGGGEVDVVMAGDQLNPDSIAALGDAASILRGVVSLPPLSAADEHPGIATFASDLEEFGGGTGDANTLGIMAHAAIQYFDELAESLLADGAEVTRESVLEAMSSATEASLPGLGITVDFTAPLESPFQFPRLFRASGFIVEAGSEGWTLTSPDEAIFIPAT